VPVVGSFKGPAGSFLSLSVNVTVTVE
jgi:hypothetical protein